MVRKLVLGLVGCAVATASAYAADSPLGVSTTFLSKYIWNGFDRLEASGLQSGPAIQPSMSLGNPETGFLMSVGGSFAIQDGNELHETTYGVRVARSVSPLVSFGLGYNYYDNRAIGFRDRDDHEIWGSLELSAAGVVKPGIAVRYEKPTQAGADPYEVIVGTLRYGMPLTGVNLAGFGVTLDWTTAALYNSGMRVGGVDVVKSGVVAYQVGVQSDLHAGPVVVTPSVMYQITVDETVNKKNPYWAAVGVAYGF
jgi:hypothetical protein